MGRCASRLSGAEDDNLTRPIDLEEVEIAIVRDEALDAGTLAHEAVGGARVPPYGLRAARQPLVRVAASEVADGRRGEARVALEELPRLARSRIALGGAAAQLACKLAQEQIVEVGALAVDDAAPPADS